MLRGLAVIGRTTELAAANERGFTPGYRRAEPCACLLAMGCACHSHLAQDA